MNILRSFSLIFAAVLLAGCEAVSDIGAGAGGGALAADLSHGNPGITAAGAAGGVLVSEGVQYAAKKQASKSYTTGYDKGRSDTAKQQYWILVNQQKTKPQPDTSVRLYEIPIPEQKIDGVVLEPTTKYLRIEE